MPVQELNRKGRIHTTQALPQTHTLQQLARNHVEIQVQIRIIQTLSHREQGGMVIIQDLPHRSSKDPAIITQDLSSPRRTLIIQERAHIIQIQERAKLTHITQIQERAQLTHITQIQE